MLSQETKNKDKPLQERFLTFIQRTIVKQVAIGAIFYVFLYLVIIGNAGPEKINITLGDFASRDIRATKDMTDDMTTERLKKEAMEKVEPRHTVDTSIQVKVKSDIHKFFTLTYSIKDDEKSNKNQQLLTFDQAKIELTRNEKLTLLNAKVEDLQKLEDYMADIVNQVMATGIKEEELAYAKENIIETFNKLEELPDDLKSIGGKIVVTHIKPNQFLDVETTEEKRLEAAEAVDPIMIKTGQIILREGEQIDEVKFNLLKKTGMLKVEHGFDYYTVFGTALIVIIFEGLIIAYLILLGRDVLISPKKLIMLAILILSMVVLSKTVYGISKFVVPIATASMLITILLDAKLSIFINMLLALLIGLITENDIQLVSLCIIGGSVGAIGASKTSQRHSIFVTGLVVSLVNVVSILAFGLINSVELEDMLSKVIYGSLNGVLSAVLTIGSLPLWESVFGVVTPLKLLELSNPNHPLLKKLLLEAPGTYHHSIVVGNLSESATEAIGGNPLIARVGAYYHDVGKLKRPYFFKENQFTGSNPHDKLNPSLSTLIITNHVKDGGDFAKKYNLPRVIEDIIRQHHGNTLVAYFYHKALKGENPDLIQEESFRYEGPRPQSKEAAIIMLADSVEAAVRSMQEPTKGKIEGLVRQIIKDKLADGQLDECDLTLRDLDTIANAFLNVLVGIFHERIEYPKLDLSELKGGI